MPKASFLRKSMTRIESSPRVGVTRYSQITQVLRDYIQKGGLKPGDRLPSLRQMVQILRISESTANRALHQLEDEGFIDRQHGRGVFVVDRLATGEIAVLVRQQALNPHSSMFYHITTQAISEMLHEKQPGWNVKVHMGKLVKETRDWAETLDLLEPSILSRLRGVFTHHPVYALERPLKWAGIPIVRLGGTIGRPRVAFDNEAFLPRAVSHLRDVGCRSVGLLWVCSAHREHRPWEEHDRILHESAAALGMDCRDEWMPMVHGDVTEMLGYELFRRFWDQPSHPDGLIVPDDVMCRGVLRAVFELGVRPPEDLRLISHAVQVVQLPYHKSVTRLEQDPLELARQAAVMMLRLVQGDHDGQDIRIVPATLIKGATT